MTKLQNVRISKGLSQSQLAAVAGISTGVLQGYESGRRSFDGAKLNTILSVCLALGCKIEDVIEDTALLEKYYCETKDI